MRIQLPRVFKGFSVMTGVALLTGCAGMNSDFGCSAKAGRACTPVAQVNRKASLGYFDHGSREAKTVAWSGVKSHRRGSERIPGPIRTSERIHRVWVAPYQDLSGNYHNANTVYMVVEKPHWAGFPVSEVSPKDDEEGTL